MSRLWDLYRECGLRGRYLRSWPAFSSVVATNSLPLFGIIIVKCGFSLKAILFLLLFTFSSKDSRGILVEGGYISYILA